MGPQILRCFLGTERRGCGLCGSKPGRRTRSQAEFDSSASEHDLSPEPFARMKQAVIALFADMERKGELD
jgi:hypothetical protein